MSRHRVPRQVLVYLHRPAGNGEREFLLLERAPERGGFWQGVSGAPEWAETDSDAAEREVREETGFDVAGRLEPVDFRYELSRPCDDSEAWDRLYGPGVEVVPEEVYEAEATPGQAPLLAPEEHVAFRWCGLEEAISLLRYEDNRRALGAVAEHLRQEDR
jgi:dATP pyrophosphohydrolase